jgi:hypothetical protein
VTVNDQTSGSETPDTGRQVDPSAVDGAIDDDVLDGVTGGATTPWSRLFGGR